MSDRLPSWHPAIQPFTPSSSEETIAAIATAPGESAIAVVRMSGANASSIGRQFLVSPGGAPLPGFEPRQARLCQVLDDSGMPLEQALVTWFRAPHSYTGEDVLELSVHGGGAAARLTLEQCLRHGARMAGPGEFTLRAFLSGRIDLSQAEAVIQVIRAKTAEGLRLAQRQLSGRLSRRVQALRGDILGFLAMVEASVDFPDDVDEPDRSELAASLDQARLLATALGREVTAGQIYQEGIRLAIVGRPNVGKSSLLNALLRHERAIVTPIPGTTRDLIEETVSIGGVPVRAIDTAGIRQTTDPVEQIGVERAMGALQGADVAILVLDRSEPLREEDWLIVGQTYGMRTVVVANKCDLPACWSARVENETLLIGGQPAQGWPHRAEYVEAAAAQGSGIPEIEKAVLRVVFGGEVLAADSLDSGSARHQIALERAASSLEHARETTLSLLPLDLVSVDLRGALQALGEITGETAPDELLHEIFSRFCIGK